jgi:type III pantothenate kinase
MTDPVLLIDQGNTRMKWMWSRDGEIDRDRVGSGDFDQFQQSCAMEIDQPASVRISSVAGEGKSAAILNFCRQQWSVSAQLMASRAEQGGVRNGYREPGMLGVDRWLAIVGAVSRYGKPVVIWDLGTATTLDAVDETGQHLGGMIFPGPDTMLGSLRRDTQLKVPDHLDAVQLAPGNSTSDCIRRGVAAAQLGALNQFLRFVSRQMESEPALLVTGGASSALLSSIEFDCTHDPWLVFRGLLID